MNNKTETEATTTSSTTDQIPELALAPEENVFSIPQVPFLAPKPVSTSNKAQPSPSDSKPAPPIASLDYTEPPWSAKVTENDAYFLEVIKNGTIVEKIMLSTKSFFTFGRLATCDVQLDHPSLSRFHAILQYSNGDSDAQFKKGFYLYDLNSTHGTVLNKTRLEPRKYVQLRNGSCLKFGASTRIYVYHEPEQPNADDLNINVTHEQMRNIKEKYSKIAMKMKINKELEEADDRGEDEADDEPQSVDWGMSRNEADEELNADAKELEGTIAGAINENDESFYSSDPRKALKIYFDREGDELFYESEEMGTGRFKCRVRLPIYNNLGEAMYAEAQGHGKKKEVVALCALEACRILDAHGVLRESKEGQTTAKRKQKDWENNDYYDSDEDNYLDRTGDVEKKRMKRMEKVGKSAAESDTKKVHTFASLQSDFETLVEEQREINVKLERCRSVIKAVQDDDLDAYISSLKSGNALDTMTRTRLKRRLLDLGQEIVKCEKLLAVAQPHGFDLVKWKDGVRSEKLAEKKDEVPLRQPVERVPIERFVVEAAKDECVEKNVEKKREEKVEKKIVKPPKPVAVEPVKNLAKEKEYNYPSNDTDYSMWMPPANQSGDGVTDLNKKLGY